MNCRNAFIARAVISAMLLVGIGPVRGFQEPYREAYRDFWIGDIASTPSGRMIPVHLQPDGFSSFLVQVLAPAELQQDLRWDILPAVHGVNVHIAGIPDQPDIPIGLSLRAQYQGRGIQRHFTIDPPPPPPEELAALDPGPVEPPSPVCPVLAIRPPGTLRENVSRLLMECGTAPGGWYTAGSDEDSFVDWKIADPLVLSADNQNGLQGLLELLYAHFGLQGLPSPGQSAIDIYSTGQTHDQ